MNERPPSMKPKVLIADDDDRFVKVLRRMLNQNGFDAFSVDDGSEVAEALSMKAVDVLLLDLQMPGMNGWEVLRALRNQLTPGRLRRGRAARAPKVVVFTGRWEEETAAFVRHLGADAYLTKPLGSDEIVRTLRTVLVS
jgi:CheY-like chemotaxis protein